MKYIGILLVAALLILSAPYIARGLAGKPLIYGDQPYYHARIAKLLINEQVSAKDTLIYNNRPLFFGPYHLLLAFTAQQSSLRTASIMLPILLGLASLIFFYLLLGRLQITGVKRAGVCLLLMTMPAYLQTFSSSNSQALAITLYLCGFYLLTVKKLQIPGFLILLSTALFGLFNMLLIFATLLIYYTKMEARKLFFITASAIIFLTSFLYYLFLSERLLPEGFLSRLISDLGGNGIGIFTLILAAAGLLFSWKRRQQYFIPFFLFLFVGAFLFIIDLGLISYLSFAIAIFAGEGFFGIYKLNWKVSLIKKLTIILIICGITFSFTSFLGRTYQMGPSQDTIISLSELSKMPEGLVFTHYSYGFWVEYYSSKPVLLDGILASESKSRFKDSQEIFSSRNLENTRRLLKKYDVKYIYIDSEMKNGKVWTRKDEGLLFLFRNNQTFKKVYDKRGTEIWQFIG